MNRDNRKLCNRMISIEETAVVAHPGIAFVVKIFMKRISKIAIKEMATIIREKISRRAATTWMNTPRAPRP